MYCIANLEIIRSQSSVQQDLFQPSNVLNFASDCPRRAGALPPGVLQHTTPLRQEHRQRHLLILGSVGALLRFAGVLIYSARFTNLSDIKLYQR